MALNKDQRFLKSCCKLIYQRRDVLQDRVELKNWIDGKCVDNTLHISVHSRDCDGTYALQKSKIPATVVAYENLMSWWGENNEGWFCVDVEDSE